MNPLSPQGERKEVGGNERELYGSSRRREVAQRLSSIDSRWPCSECPESRWDRRIDNVVEVDVVVVIVVVNVFVIAIVFVIVIVIMIVIVVALLFVL